MNKEKSLEQFKKSINLMFENNDKEIYLHKDDALKIEYYIYSLEQQVKKQQQVIDKATEWVRDWTRGTNDCFDEEEHEKLKKQLEELKEEKQEWINLLAMFKNQQKEFIKWLEDYLKLFDNMCIDEQGYYDMLEEILQKYKSIIGVSDEKK